MFINDASLSSITWQGLERAICRLLLHHGFEGIRLVGQTRDQGADIIAHKAGRRWLFQVKRWKKRAGLDTVDRTLEALQTYRAQVPVVVCLGGFEDAVREHQRVLMSRHVPLQLWDRPRLLDMMARVPRHYISARTPRPYQEEAIQAVVQTFGAGATNRAMVVMATGLGKTFTACESIRRMQSTRPLKVLALVHTNELVYQMERAFWPFLTAQQETLVWNGYERPEPDDVERAPFVFGCLNSVSEHLERGGDLPPFDLILIDECHHVGGEMYRRILHQTRAGESDGPFLLGLTATPWRPDETDLEEYFGPPLVSVDIVTGMLHGFLTNVDYRMYTDNIRWEALADLKGARFTPRAINRTLFITEWDDAVVFELQKVWKEQPNPRAIVFCGTVDHAITMRDRINALGFCNAAAIYSRTAAGRVMEPAERNRTLSDFHDGVVNVVCAVDIFNEGVDVPDVNIVVFQRVTHSRRIFVQQLGRGLRLAPGKEKVVVLDFVSDIRRFAAGLDLKEKLDDGTGPAPGNPQRIRVGHKVTFQRVGGEDPQAESFLRNWLEDVAAVEAAGEDASVLKYPPELPGGAR